MKSVNLIVAIICLVSTVYASCNVDDVSCEVPVSFTGDARVFYISNYSPQHHQTGVNLDVTLSLTFTDAVPSSQGFNGYFYLLNQSKGISTEIPSSCIHVVNRYTLEMPVMKCLGDVLEPLTAYVVYISQRMVNNQVKSLASIKGIPIDEKAFGLEYKSIVFHTTELMSVHVVAAKCSPLFNAVDVPMKTTVTIAFDSIVHIGFGKIELRAINHPASSILLDVTDNKHIVLGTDNQSVVVYDINLKGLEKYQVVFDSSIVLSASGSKCDTVDDYFFTAASDEEKPSIMFISPKNYKTNLPRNSVIRIVFSENVIPNTGMIMFTGSKSEINVNVQSTTEVRCVRDECLIEPSHKFDVDTYSMMFGENAFVDQSGNTLVKGINNHIFSVSDNECGLGYVHVNNDESCYCQSNQNQCQCQCGETYFVKDYE